MHEIDLFSLKLRFIFIKENKIQKKKRKIKDYPSVIISILNSQTRVHNNKPSDIGEEKYNTYKTPIYINKDKTKAMKIFKDLNNILTYSRNTTPNTTNNHNLQNKKLQNRARIENEKEFLLKEERKIVKNFDD